MKTIKILIADSKPIEVNRIEAILSEKIKKNEYKTIKALDGVDAWVEIKKNSPDILLLDLNLPELNGIELLKKITTHKIDIKTIVLGSDKDNTKENIYITLSENKAFNFLAKPIDSQALKNSIEKALERSYEEKQGLIAAKRIVTNLSTKQKLKLLEKILDELPFNLLPKKYIISLISKLNELLSEKEETNLNFKKLEALDPQREKEGKIPIKLLSKASLDISSDKYLSLRWRNNEGKLDYKYFKPEDFEDPLTLKIIKEKIKTKKKPLTKSQLLNISNYYQVPDLLELQEKSI